MGFLKAIKGLSKIDFVLLKANKQVTLSKVYHKRYTDYIWISKRIESEEFRIIKKLRAKYIREFGYDKKYKRISLNRNKEIIFKPPQCSFFITKKRIRLSKIFAWLVGFYLAEGDKGRNTIGVSNKELNLILKTINIFQMTFGIKKDSWAFYIKTSQRDSKELEKIKNKWSKVVKREFKIGYARYGYEECIEIRINSRVLAWHVRNIFEKYIDNILKNKKLSREFIKGYIIGDGGTTLRGKQIHSVSITSKNTEYVQYLRKAFILLYNEEPNLREIKGCYELYYCNVHIISKIVLDGLFDDSKRQQLKLVNGYKNKQYTRARIKYWRHIINKSRHPEDIAELSNNSHWSVRDALNKDIKLGIVTINNKHINRCGPPRKYYKLSRLGRKLFKKIEV